MLLCRQHSENRNQLKAQEPIYIPFFIFVSNTHEFNLSFEITSPESAFYLHFYFSPIRICFFSVLFLYLLLLAEVEVGIGIR